MGAPFCIYPLPSTVYHQPAAFAGLSAQQDGDTKIQAAASFAITVDAVAGEVGRLFLNWVRRLVPPIANIAIICYRQYATGTTRQGIQMNVSLTPEFEAFVNEKVKHGSYGSASEVVRAGLRLLQERDAELAARLEALRRDVRVGRAQLERGESVSGADAFSRLRKKRPPRRSP